MTLPAAKIERSAWYLFLLFVFSLCTMKPWLVVLGQRLVPADLIFPLVVIFWVAALAGGGIKLRNIRTLVVVGIYIMAMLLAALFSVERSHSLLKLVGIGYLGLVAVVACQVIDSADRLRLTVTAFLAGAVVPVAIGLLTVFCFYFAPNTDILQYFTHHYGVVPVGNYPRISSTFISASMLMNYLTVALALLMLVRQKYVLSSTVFFAAAAALIVCSGFTISIGLGAVFLIISIYLYISTNGRTSLIRAVYAVFGIVGATTFLLIAPFTLQTNSKASPSVTIPFVQIELFASPRALIWEEASAKFLDDPLTGSGPGTPAANLLFRNSDGSTSILTDAHNTFLSVAVQAGILGLLALVLLCYHVLRAPFRPPWSHDLKYRISAWLGIAFFSAFIYQGLTGSFEDARHLWLLIGLIAAATSIERGETSDCRTIARPVCL